MPAALLRLDFSLLLFSLHDLGLFLNVIVICCHEHGHDYRAKDNPDNTKKVHPAHYPKKDKRGVDVGLFTYYSRLEDVINAAHYQGAVKQKPDSPEQHEPVT